jgi:hypothetical protein
VDHRDYHRWDRNEGLVYVKWETETHREHREFRARAVEEQKAYWEWRHGR